MYSNPAFHVIDDRGFVRVRVVSAVGKEVFPGVMGNDPKPAIENMDELGWCDEKAIPEGWDHSNPKIYLDNGNIIWGYECWWQPVLTPLGEQREAEFRALRELYQKSVDSIYSKYDNLANLNTGE